MIPAITSETIANLNTGIDRYSTTYITGMMKQMGEENPELARGIIALAIETANKVAVPGTSQWMIVQTHVLFSSLLTYKAIQTQMEINDLEESAND